MKANEIKLGGLYTARVGGNITTVRVDRIVSGRGAKGDRTYYEVTNLKTGRRTTFRSAAKFRGMAGETPLDAAKRKAKETADERLDRVAAQTVAHDRRQAEAEHRKGTATPLAKAVIGPLIDKLIKDGVLPKPVGGYEINNGAKAEQYQAGESHAATE